jgi:hypothetical protein
MRQAFGIRHMLIWGIAFLMVATLYACGGQQSQPEQAAAPEASSAKLPKKYANILSYVFESTPQVAKEYPNAVNTVQQSMTTALQQKNRFKNVGMLKMNQKTKGDTLLVKATVTDLRIVSGAARMWGGVFVGSSGIEVKLTLIDGGTKQQIREEVLNSNNNAWAASYTGGSSDQSLPDDMGKILANYITAIMP